MVLLIRKLSILMTLLVVTIIGAFFIFRIIENSLVEKRQLQISIHGHSHARYALNPNLLSQKVGKSLNLAEDGQSMFWSLIGAEKLVRRNRIKVIAINYSNNTLTTDWWTVSSDRITNNKQFNYTLTFNQWSGLFEKQPFLTTKLFCTLPFPNPNLFDSYLFNNAIRLKEDISTKGKRIKVQYKKITSFRKSENFQELFKFCKRHRNQQIVLFRTPVHAKFFEFFGSVMNEEVYQASIRELCKNKNVRFLDYLETHMEDEFFADIDHLSGKGSIKFTKLFYSDLKSLNCFK